jgi:uncharacterized MnhB-related membrane protein
MSLADLFRQLSILIGLPTVVLACAGAAAIVVARDWRLSLFGYALVSLMLALLLSQIIPTDWALLQAITGGLIAVILFLSARQLRWTADTGQPWEMRWPILASLTSLRVLAVALAAVTFAVVRGRVSIPGLDPLFRDALLWLVMMGLLGLSLHSEPLHAGLSLLVFLGAAELLLFTLFQRRMLIGLWLGGQVLLGLAIAYLVVARGLAALPGDETPERADSDSRFYGGQT